MDDRIDFMAAKDFLENSFITDIALDTYPPNDGFPMPRLQVVEDDGFDSPFQKPLYDMTTNITGSSGYQNLPHLGFSCEFKGYIFFHCNALTFFLSTRSALEFPDFFGDSLVPERNVLENWHDGRSHLEYWNNGILE